MLPVGYVGPGRLCRGAGGCRQVVALGIPNVDALVLGEEWKVAGQVEGKLVGFQSADHGVHGEGEGYLDCGVEFLLYYGGDGLGGSQLPHQDNPFVLAIVIYVI